MLLNLHASCYLSPFISSYLLFLEIVSEKIQKYDGVYGSRSTR